MTGPGSPALTDEDLAQYSASNIEQVLEGKRRDVQALRVRIPDQSEPEPEPEPEPEQEPDVHSVPVSSGGDSQRQPKARVYHVKVSLTNVRRFPTLARYSQLDGATHRKKPASARYGQPSNWTPNMRDLHNTRLLPPTDYEIIPPTLVSENAYFEQRMRTTAPVVEKPKFYPSNASAARQDLANSGSASCLPPSPQTGPAWAFSGNPQWQPSVRQTIGGQDVAFAKTMPPFRPSSASAARDQIKGRVTLYSADDKQRVHEARRQKEMARECAMTYANSYTTASRPQPRLSWMKAW
jgi:hypothetical protein|eukprot:COSAG02_NODE_2540_length_8575_cov_4.856435_3_plen_295_part_00